MATDDSETQKTVFNTPNPTELKQVAKENHSNQLAIPDFYFRLLASLQ